MAYVPRKRTYKRRSSTSTPFKRVAKKAVRQAARKVFRKRVKRIISSVAETKTISNVGAKLPLCLQDSTQSVSQNMLQLCPGTAAESTSIDSITIDYGTQDGQRIGNMVRPVKAWLNLIMVPETWNNVSNQFPRPMNIRIWFFRTKRNQQSIPSAFSLAGVQGNFLQSGTTQSGLLGNFSDNLFMMNSDTYVYLGHKDCKLGFAVYNGAGTNPQPLDQNYASNDFKLNVHLKINLMKYLPKKFTWDDTGAPTHPYTYMLIQPMSCDGTTIANNQFPMRYEYQFGYKYKDV